MRGTGKYILQMWGFSAWQFHSFVLRLTNTVIIQKIHIINKHIGIRTDNAVGFIVIVKQNKIQRIDEIITKVQAVQSNYSCRRKILKITKQE